MTVKLVPTATHWGLFNAEVVEGRVVGLHPYEGDPDPSPIGRSLAGITDHACRIDRPMVRSGYLSEGPRAEGNRRGAEPFVAVSWEQALDLAADALQAVRDRHGNQAIYGGSYGWASAGRFHHAQGQLRRFLNLFGGCTYSVNTYSTAAAEVILGRVFAPKDRMFAETWSWRDITSHSDLVLSFGGLPLKNAQVNAGGLGRHETAQGLRDCRRAGVQFVNVSPIRDDMADFVEAEHLSPRPNSDTAVMLGLAHSLLDQGLQDDAFLATHCTGFELFRRYLTGERDGTAKDADWAETISGIPADSLRDLARRLARGRSLITLSWSLQRADHGEQPYWMAVTLAAMLGQIGLPGGGVGFGYCAVHGIGKPPPPFRWGAVEQGENPVRSFIPVARIADLLLEPGATIDYNGGKITFPDIKLVYWAGGNPFHHHQDLNRLRLAWQRPETVIVHEPFWTATARHADIVLPATLALERNDFACSNLDGFLAPMHQAVAPHGEARNDHDIFAALAARLGFAERFTEGRDEMEWLRHLHEISRQRAGRYGHELPAFDDFWAGGPHELEIEPGGPGLLARFRNAPDRHPLPTPSGKIEIFSETIAGFGYQDCPGHPVWLEPSEWLGAEQARRFPLHLISDQPRTRLHSQLDHGANSQDSKVQGREPLRLNPADAQARGIVEGDLVRLFNDRGACLAGAILSEAIAPGVVQLSTGAWYDPQDPSAARSLDLHGNPNVLTLDKGCSKLSQGPSAQTALVEVERFTGPAAPVAAFDQPVIE